MSKKKVRPPKYARKNARKALKCLDKGSEAMTSAGRKRARELSKGEPLNLKDLKEIDSFRRHKKNARFEKKICKDKGAVAWLGWGAGFDNGKPDDRFMDWAKRKKKKLRRKNEK